MFTRFPRYILARIGLLGLGVMLGAASIHAASITFVGHQDGVEQDADDATIGWHNSSPSKSLDIDIDNILGSDGYEVAGQKSDPDYAWILRRSPAFNAAASWGKWDTPSNPAGSDTLNAAVYHDTSADSTDAFEIVINGDGLAGRTLRVGILYGVNANDSSTFTVTQTVGGNERVTTPALTHDGLALNAAFFNITGAQDGDTFRISTTIIGGGVEQVGGITLDSAPTTTETELPEVEGTVRGTYEAPLEVSGIFSDNGVLQRGRTLPVWGWDDPGTEVTVQFAGQTVSGTADSRGRWTAELQPLTANSTPQSMTVSAGAETVTIQNLLVGDVWLCSGQSNMEMDFNGNQYQADLPAFINPDNFPTIRHIKIEGSKAEFPQKQLPQGNASWTVCDSTEVLDYTAVGFFFAYFISQETGVPVGLINSTFGNTRIGEWVTPDSIDLVTDQISASSFRGVFDPEPSKNYFAQIAPLRGYGLTGALWYQGESNGSEGEEYFWKMKALFQGWRNEWSQGNFPFYYAQLPSYDGSGSWAPIREAQRRALTLSNTGMATLVDVGGVGLDWPINLHPPNKYDVGRRLAQWALANDYGQTGLVTSGPLFKSAQFQGANVTIEYDYVGSGLVKAKKPSPQSIDPPEPVADLTGFELAGADNAWHPADAVINGATVVLSSASVPEPEAARYLYAMNTDNGTLYNLEDLPAAPFLTTAADNPTPPSAPAGVTATPGDGRVDLAWNAATGADSYDVKRGTAAGGPYASVGSPSGTTFADTTVSNGTTYYYVVSALNTAGESANSNEVSATPKVATDPPDAPTGLDATGGDGRVDLVWAASANADSYTVKRGSLTGGPYTGIGTTPGTSFTDTTADNGTTYYYVVSATNEFGESSNSTEASATPQAPTGGAGITIVGTQSSIDDDGDNPNDGWRNASFAKPLDIDGDNILGTDGWYLQPNNSQPAYATVTHLGNSNGSTPWGLWDHPANPSASDSLVAGMFHDSQSDTGADILEIEITDSLGSDTLRLGLFYDVISTSGSRRFAVRQTVGGSAVTTTAELPIDGDLDVVFFDLTGLSVGDTFIVSADNLSSGTGEEIAGVVFDTGVASSNPPDAPTGLIATAGDGRVDLSWNASTGAVSYNLKRGTTEGGPYSTVGSPTTSSFSDTTVSNDTTYYYVVSAVNAVGESADSSEASATPVADTSPPDTPTGLEATAGDQQVDLSWSASVDADSYNLKRATVAGGPYSTIGIPTTNSYSDTTVSNGTTYYYVVSAVNANGESGDSSEASATPQVPPPAATITFVSDAGQLSIDDDSEGTTVGDGWRTPSFAKPGDLDGDNVLGTDGYFTNTATSKPSYATVTRISANLNSASNWGLWDDPTGSVGPSVPDSSQAGVFHDANVGNNESAELLSFTIDTDLTDTLRVGLLYDVLDTGTGTFTLTQTAGSGTGTATTSTLTFDKVMDVAYFDITGAQSGDTFVISGTTLTGTAVEQLGGITFDTGVISSDDTYADWMSGFSGLEGQTALDDDPDGDGNENGIENYFGTHPGEFSQGIVAGTVSGSTMTFTHPLNDSPASDISASYRWSKDLASFHADGASFEGTTVSFSQGTPVDGVVEVTASISGTGLDQLFVDIEVTQN